MRLKRIDVDSYGSVSQWHSGELDDNLNIIYGPNEAGKSTITEFIRSTLFPIRISKYPGSSKTDSGTIVVEMDNGDTRTLKREQKKVTETTGKRTVAEEFSSMDPDTYRALYGLDLDQLVNSKLISSGEFRSRFMTVPGGDNIPTVTNDINDRISALMNRDRLTDNKIVGACNKEIRETERLISEAFAVKDDYDALYAQREDLKRKVNENKTLVEASRDEKMKKKMMRAQSANLRRLEELEDRRRDVERYADVNIADKIRVDTLSSSIEELRQELPDEVIDDKDRAVVISRKDEIEDLYKGFSDYRSKKSEIGRLKDQVSDADDEIKRMEKDTGWKLDKALTVRTGAPIVTKAKGAIRRDSDKKGVNDRTVMGIGIGGILFAVLGILFIAKIIDIGEPSTMVGIGIGAVGLISIAVAFIIPRMNLQKADQSFDWNDWIIGEGYPNGTTPEEAITLANDLQTMKDLGKRRSDIQQTMEDLQDEVDSYEKRCTPVAKSLKVDGDGVEEKVEAVYSKLQQALVEEKEAERIKGLQSSIAARNKERNSIIRRYGSEEELIDAYEGKMEYDSIQKEIATISQTIESSSNVSLNELRSFLNDDEGVDIDVLNDDTEEYSQQIGEINIRMENIMKDDEIVELQTRKCSAEARMKKALREWAVYNIANAMIHDACDHFYSDLQPSVVKTANRYLGIMTEGRYRLDSNPSNDEIAVRDERSSKTSNQWSSGLVDQVYLSLKMALAQEMGSERMPMLMDDVLVRFDHERKEAACGAIYEFSRTNQVILFTCDPSLANYFRIHGSVNEIRL